MKNVVYISFLLLISSRLLAQGVLITGSVVAAEDGAVLLGVNISLKGTTTGTQTDANGSYKIMVDKGATLVFTFIGFTTQDVTVDNRRVINVSLQGAVNVLDEVI